jgi:glutathione S-transferase
MKLYNSIGPNPKVVRMFMAERGIEIEKHEVDLMGGENRQAEYVKMNPGGQLPALELDNGDVISEITCICEYLDEHAGSSSLIGETPEQRAETRMWVRRIDLGILENLANGFRFSDGQALFKDRMTLIPHAADSLKSLAQEKLTWLDGLLEGKEFVCGDRFSLADILLFVFLEFGEQVGQAINGDNKNVVALFERVKARPSASV